MKSKVIITIIVLTAILSNAVTAQLPHISLYAHGLYAAPVDNNSKDYFKLGLGAVAGLTLGSNNTRGVVSVGYTNFFEKHDSPQHKLGDETYVLVKVGVRKYLPLTLHIFYVQGDLGTAFTGNKDVSGTVNRFAADIGVGAHLTALEAAVFYDGFNQSYGWSSWVTFQLGFNLGF